MATHESYHQQCWGYQKMVSTKTQYQKDRLYERLMKRGDKKESKKNEENGNSKQEA